MVVPDALDDIIDMVAKKLKLELGDGETWSRLDALTETSRFVDEALNLMPQASQPHRTALRFLGGRCVWLSRS